MKYRNLLAVVGGVCGLLAAGCSSARDVEVSGKVTAPSTLMVGDKLVVEFVDLVGEGADVEQSVAHSAELKAPGDFKETVPLEGNEVLIRAIDDRNGDGKCTAGEAWGEVKAAIVDDKVEPVSVMLGTAACPAEASAE